MRYERMTMEEYRTPSKINRFKSRKNRRHVVGGSSTFFSDPLSLLPRSILHLTEYPVRSFIGGCLHAIPPRSTGNTLMNFFVYDDLQNYDLGRLNEKHRYITRKGIRNFTACQLTDREQFTEEAYGIYVSFYNRTGYEYRKERLDQACFREWAGKIFDTPGMLVIGAYREGKLSAIDISCHVEDLIIDDIFFSDTESLSLKVTDFLLHTIRETAASSDATYLFRGLPTGQRTLDESKIMRGCKILQKPALLRLNRVALYAARDLYEVQLHEVTR